jgi:hypothetical protein
MPQFTLVITDEEGKTVATLVTADIEPKGNNKWELVRRVLQDAFIYAGLNMRRKDL